MGLAEQARPSSPQQAFAMHWFLSDPQEWATFHFGRAELDDPRRARPLPPRPAPGAPGELCCLAGAQLLVRKRAPKGETSPQRLARPRETDRWGETADLIGPPSAEVQWIHVWDREGDNYETFCRCLNQRCDLV